VLRAESLDSHPDELYEHFVSLGSFQRVPPTGMADRARAARVSVRAPALTFAHVEPPPWAGSHLRGDRSRQDGASRWSGRARVAEHTGGSVLHVRAAGGRATDDPRGGADRRSSSRYVRDRDDIADDDARVFVTNYDRLHLVSVRAGSSASCCDESFNPEAPHVEDSRGAHRIRSRHAVAPMRDGDARAERLYRARDAC
jgi:hypothetical protein